MLDFFRQFAKRENVTALGMIAAIGGISLVLALTATAFSRYRSLELAKEQRHSAYEDELRRLSGITTNLKPMPDPTADWKVYENKKYNFSIKYPQDWQAPRESSAAGGENFISKISFNEKGVSGTNGGKGLDVFIFSSAKFPGPVGTDNLKKKNENIASEDCPKIDDITLGGKGYPAKEVNISPDNPCWEETFFYSLTKSGHTYNIVPRQNESANVLEDAKKIGVSRYFPEFYDAVSTLDLAEQQASLVQVPKKIVQKAAAPPKVRYTTGASCAHKKDKPRKSKTKGKHMDEDCCPDPDEWPNPRCAQSAGGLGLMRSGPK